MAKSGYEFACKKKHETAKAILVWEPVTDSELWFPLETVNEMHFDKNGDGYIVVEEWIARKKGLC